jgi:hypothetical protein
MWQTQNKTLWSFLYIGWIGIVCVVLLILNFELVRIAIQTFAILGRDARAEKMIQFFLPILMIFLEFRIFDFLIDRADRTSEPEVTDERGPS